MNMQIQKVLLERVHSDNAYSLFFMMGKRFQIPLKDDQYWPRQKAIQRTFASRLIMAQH